MTEKRINLRICHMGKFQNKEYVGGKECVLSNLDSDWFSYTVLMDHVKDELKYTEIGGIYARDGNQQEGWKMVANDQDLLELSKNGGHIDLYIDNTVDTRFEPLQQMQPFVVIRPRPNVFEGIKLF